MGNIETKWLNYWIINKNSEKENYPIINKNNENQMELTVHNYPCTSVSYIIQNNIFTSKELSSGLMCCSSPKYNVETFHANTLDELIETLPNKYKEKIKDIYIYLKKRKFRKEEYKLYGTNILKQLTGIKETDVICQDEPLCLWFGSESKKLKKCPEKRMCCPVFNADCQTDIKKNKLQAHLFHKCNYCDFISQNKDLFLKHLYTCDCRIVRCNNCYWKGKSVDKYKHFCVNGSNKKNENMYITFDRVGRILHEQEEYFDI